MADESSRHAVDACLRAHGFKIHARPAKGEPTWERHGAVLSQRAALALCPRQDVERAQAAQDRHEKLVCR